MKEANRRFDELLNRPDEASAALPPKPVAAVTLSIGDGVEKFLDWCQQIDLQLRGITV